MLMVARGSRSNSKVAVCQSTGAVRHAELMDPFLSLIQCPLGSLLSGEKAGATYLNKLARCQTDNGNAGFRRIPLLSVGVRQWERVIGLECRGAGGARYIKSSETKCRVYKSQPMISNDV